VKLLFDLPLELAATLQNRAGNKQARVDEIVESALLHYLERESTGQEADGMLDFTLPPELRAKLTHIEAKANLDVDAIVQVALRQYFSQGRTPLDTLPAILTRLTGIPAQTTHA